MHTMDSDIKRLVREWKITPEMALKYAANPKSLLS
jgi:hypothetical protein